MNLQEEVWTGAVIDLEGEVLRACPTLCGGRQKDESVKRGTK